MRPVAIKDDIYWVGAIDWDKRNFHGYALSPEGTTYNAFLVKDEKTVLIDTVEDHYAPQLFCHLAHLGVEKLDIMVVNHVEMDHSGSLPQIIERYKPERILCSPMGEKALKAHFHYKDWPVEVVPGGTEVSIGKRTLHFVETRMLHWPDNMLTYIPEDKIAFSSDAFGQNWATSERFSDEVDHHMLERLMMRYYANIVCPYSPMVLKVLDSLGEMNLDIDMLCPDHGLIWRGKDEVAFALEKYREYALQKPRNRAVIVFDTMWHSTEKMGLAIASGLNDAGVSVRVMSAKYNHHSDIMTEVFEAGAVIVGSPTHNNGILPMVAEVLTYLKGLRPQNKLGAVFGSFGWSGECVKILGDWLESMGCEMVDAPVKVKNIPEHEQLAACYELGKKIAEALKAKIEA